MIPVHVAVVKNIKSVVENNERENKKSLDKESRFLYSISVLILIVH